MILERRRILADAPVVSSMKEEEISRRREQLVDENHKTEVASRNCRRSLKFHDTTSILWIESAADMSEDEINACYYNNDDYICFRDREKKMSRHFSGWGLMKAKKNDDILGVETRMQRFHRRQRSKNSVFAVIFEQEIRQESMRDGASRTAGDTEDDDVVIARVYEQHTKESARLARERAISNANQVEKLYPSILYTNESRSGLMEMNIRDKKGVGVKISPWDVPKSSKVTSSKNRSQGTVRYASFPILPHHYLEFSCTENKEAEVEEQRDIFLGIRPEYQSDKIHHQRLHHGAPIQQKINRSHQNFNFRRPTSIFDAQNDLNSSPYGCTYDNKQPRTALSNQWTWNAIHCDAVTPSSISRYFPWDLY